MGSQRARQALVLHSARGWEELTPELEELMPELTYQERKSVAESRVSIAEKMAKVTEMTGCDWHDGLTRASDGSSGCRY
jgi:hypothetical protein